MFFNRKSYDYRELSKKWTLLISQRTTTADFHRNLLKFAAETAQTKGGCLILKEKGLEHFSVRACLDGRYFSFEPKESLGLIRWLEKNKKAITKQKILEEAQFLPIKIHGLNFFLQFQAEACIPLCQKENLIGFIVLGPKKEGRPYSEELLEVLDWLGAQMVQVLQNTFLEDQVRSQQAELETVGDLKSQIIANLSHELRTPLTSILGFAEILAEEIDGPLNQEQKKHARRVIDGGERLLKTLSALVDMAKLEAGQYPVNVSQFHLLPLVEGISEEIPVNQDTALNIDFDSQTPFVYGDLQLVRQVFINLLDNAAKYTPQGSIDVTANKKGEMLEVCVSDTGIGIAEEKVPDIFKGFYQVSSGLGREFQGSGVGLSLSKKLVEAHGGRLWVKSQPGTGSRFYFTLPLKPVVIKQRELAA